MNFVLESYGVKAIKEERNLFIHNGLFYINILLINKREGE